MNPLQKLAFRLAFPKQAKQLPTLVDGFTVIGRLPGAQGVVWKDWTAEKAIKEGFKASAVVYRCVDIITETAASAPLKVYQRVDDSWEPAPPEHPLSQLLQTPQVGVKVGSFTAPYFAQKRMYKRAVQHLLLAGNAIWRKNRGKRNGPVLELWPWMPDVVTPSLDDRGILQGYAFAGMRETVAPQDVVHFMLENPENPWWGIGKLQAGFKTVETETAAIDWNVSTIREDTHTRGVLSYSAELSDDQYQRLREQMEERKVGGAKAGQSMILGTDLQYTRVSLTPQELDWLQSRQFTREEIAMMFGVPAPLLNPANATLANVEAYNRQFWQNTIVPLNSGIADILNATLTPEFGDPADLTIDHDYSTIPAMQEERGEQVRDFQTLVRSGVKPEVASAWLDMGLPDDAFSEQPILGGFMSGKGPSNRKAIEREEEKAAYWKSRDDDRRRWENRITSEMAGIFEDEGKAAAAAYQRGGMVAAMVAIGESEAVWVGTLSGVYRAVMEHFGSIELNRHAPKARVTFNIFNEGVQQFIRTQVGRKVVLISESSKTKIRQVVGEMVAQNASTDRIARRILETYKGWEQGESAIGFSRAMTIARTEVGAAMNAGHDYGARQASEDYGLVMVKRWISSRDDRVRESHMDVDGETVGMDEDFSIGLTYPGDPNGAPEEVIQCRCVVAYESVRR